MLKGSKKRSKKKRWVCKECPGWELSPHVCKHLEALIQEPQVRQPTIMHYRDIDNFQERYTIVIPENILNGQWEAEFREKLKQYGLEPIFINIVVMRFLYEMSLKEIAKELEIVSPSTVLGLLRRSLQMLKERGFNSRK